jgi:DNA-binding response OmpR family regulator
MKILVIDDDTNVSQAMRAILAQHRYDTILVPRATAGLLALAFDRFNLVIVDIFMPGMGGLDTIAQIRKQSSIPIIAASGFHMRHRPDIDYHAGALRYGATACLRKPFTPSQLIATVDKCLA